MGGRDARGGGGPSPAMTAPPTFLEEPPPSVRLSLPTPVAVSRSSTEQIQHTPARTFRRSSAQPNQNCPAEPDRPRPRQSSHARYVASGTRIVTPGRSEATNAASQSRLPCNTARVSSNQACPSSQAATVASTPVTLGDPSRRGDIRATNRSFSVPPKCIVAQRKAGMLKLLVAEVMVIVRAAMSGGCESRRGRRCRQGFRPTRRSGRAG